VAAKWSGSATLKGDINDTRDHCSAVSLKPPTSGHSNLKVECLGNFESIYETALTCGSGAQIEFFDEKKPEVENLVIGSL
jgi:hypothetical protein